MLGLMAALFCFIAKAQSDSALIPVRLSSLQGNLAGTTVTLRWTTVCFLSYAYFEVQQSVDGKTYTTVQSFSADKVRCQQPFEWKDTLQSSTNVFYRVNVGDADNRFSQSKVVSIVKRQSSIKKISVYPTLVHASANIVVNADVEGEYTLSLINAGGIPVKQYHYWLSKGQSYFSLDLGGLSNGHYWLAVVDKQGSANTVAIIKQ